MGVLIKKQRGFYSFTGVAKLSIIAFIVALAYSFVDTIWAVYAESIFHNLSTISFYSSFLSVLAFASYFFLIPIIEKRNKSKLFSVSLIFVGISFLIFFLSRNFVLFVLSSIILTVFTSLRINSFGIIVRDRSSSKNISRNEGLMYTFFNIAWLIGPLLAGYIAQAFGVYLIFLFSAIFIAVGLLLFKFSNINDANISKKAEYGIVKNFVSFFKNKRLRNAYIVGGGVNFWLILIYLYMPLYILQKGLNDIWIGYFLFGITVPVVLFEYFFSKLAGKIGFKKIFKVGFFILFASALACFFIESIYVAMLILVFASIGIAMLEPTTEAYFFEVLRSKEEENKFYGPYNTTIDASHFVGKLLAGVLFLFLPFRFVFVFFAFFMFLYFLFCFKLIEAKKRK